MFKIAARKQLRDLQRQSGAQSFLRHWRAALDAEVRAMMLLRANVLALGFSGIRLEVIELSDRNAESRRAPGRSGKRSVGASGDLAPLAHLGPGADR